MRFWKVAKIRFVEAAAFFALSLLLGLPAQSAEVRDATGALIRLVDHPKRIVTLMPSLAELAASLSAGNLDRIVGVSEYTDFPSELTRVASIGQYSRFNLEKVVSLKPDLVLASRNGNAKDQVLHLRELGVPVVVVDTEGFTQIADSMRLVAKAMGAAPDGEKMASRFQEGVARVRTRTDKRTGAKPRVLIQVGDEPLVTIGKGSFLQGALEVIGAANLYADGKVDYPRPAIEDVVHRDPDIILVIALGNEVAPFEAMAKRWENFKTMTAVKNKRVKVLKADALLRPTLRLNEGLDALEKAVHGEK